MGTGPYFTRIRNVAAATQAALAWFKAAVQKLSGYEVPVVISQESVVTQEEQMQAAIKAGLFKPMEYTNIGQMFLFKYDPKWKKRLPYWDEFPLVFPIGTFPGGFMAINLHYLPMGFRMPILNHLATMSNDSDKYDDEGRLDITYGILKNYSIMFDRFYKGCVKKYLYSHVRSDFQYVNPKNWNHVAMLPFERWGYNK